MTTARSVTHVMGMPVSLALRGRHTGDDDARSAWAEAVQILHEVDRTFSTYRSDSLISRLDRGELIPAQCPPEVREVLELGAQAARQSDGAFSVYRPDPDGRRRLDPNGVVKGWAVERAAEPLRRLAETDFCLSAGGDMVCHTADPDGTPWRIGIEDPHDPRRLIAVMPVRNGAVATSGTVHRGEHLVDARTGQAPTGVASVTVVAPTLTWADIDATAAYAHGVDAAGWLSRRPIRAGLVVWSDGSHTRVSGAVPVSLSRQVVTAAASR